VTPPQKPKSRLEAHAPKCARCRTLMKVRISFLAARLTTWPTVARSAVERSGNPCHGRGEVETNDVDVVYRRNLACTPAGICSTSTWRRVRLDDGFSISVEIGYR
jgi:hypothetical protein